MENENCNKRNKMPPSPSGIVESIEDFSDDILTRILSFLPTNEAFRTTVLSKRWLPLCYSLSVLEIQDRGLHNSKDWIHFRRFTDAVMFSPRSQHSTLNSFRLICWSKLCETEADCFNKWVEAAKRRRVQVLRLHFVDLLLVPLAPTIFCCKTLVELCLTGIHVGTLHHGSADLPLLKTLNMFNIRLENMEDFMKLLSGCPLLENLETRHVKTTTDVTTRGYFKPLSKLINAKICLFVIPLRAVYNVQFLHVSKMGRNDRDEEINSYYKGFPVFENLTNLQLSWFLGVHDWNEVVKMLHYCPKLQTLKIEKWMGPSNLTKEDWKYPDHVPECVTSNLRTCEIIHYQDVEADLRFATYILQNARILQVMAIPSPLFRNPKASPQFLEDLISCPRISSACKLSFI